MKTVFNGPMVAHVWAQQSQSHGKNNNGQLYFEGPSIFSYGAHFCLASFHETKLGRVVLFNCNSYSITTSKHQSWVRQSVDSSIPRFFVNEPRYPEHAKQDFEQRITEALEAMRNAKYNTTREAYHANACELVEQANKFSKIFGYRWKLKAIAPLSHELVAKLKKAKKANDAKAAKAKAEREMAFKVRAVAAYQEWISGEASSGYRIEAPCGGVALRIAKRDSGDLLQTSQGAEVPLAHAIRAFRFVKLCKEQGIAWQRNGHSLMVGRFTIDKIEPSGDFVAGCHSIKWPEIERIAKLANVYDIEPNKEALTESEEKANA